MRWHEVSDGIGTSKQHGTGYKYSAIASMPLANAAMPVKSNVKIGLSLSTMRAIRVSSGVWSGFSRYDTMKDKVIVNLSTFGSTARK
jgi:hypothetical protein